MNFLKNLIDNLSESKAAFWGAIAALFAKAIWSFTKKISRKVIESVSKEFWEEIRQEIKVIVNPLVEKLEKDIEEIKNNNTQNILSPKDIELLKELNESLKNLKK